MRECIGRPGDCLVFEAAHRMRIGELIKLVQSGKLTLKPHVGNWNAALMQLIQLGARVVAYDRNVSNGYDYGGRQYGDFFYQPASLVLNQRSHRLAEAIPETLAAALRVQQYPYPFANGDIFNPSPSGLHFRTTKRLVPRISTTSEQLIAHERAVCLMLREACLRMPELFRRYVIEGRYCTIKANTYTPDRMLDNIWELNFSLYEKVVCKKRVAINGCVPQIVAINILQAALFSLEQQSATVCVGCDREADYMLDPLNYEIALSLYDSWRQIPQLGLPQQLRLVHVPYESLWTAIDVRSNRYMDPQHLSQYDLLVHPDTTMHVPDQTYGCTLLELRRAAQPYD